MPRGSYYIRIPWCFPNCISSACRSNGSGLSKFKSRCLSSRVSMYQQTFPINSTGRVGMSPGSCWKVQSDSIHGKPRGSVSPTDGINRTSKAGKMLGQSLHAVKVQLLCWPSMGSLSLGLLAPSSPHSPSSSHSPRSLSPSQSPFTNACWIFQLCAMSLLVAACHS